MISMLTGSNPFYREPRRLQEASEYEVPDFIIERALMEEIEELEEGSYLPSPSIATVQHGEEHSSVSKHIGKHLPYKGKNEHKNANFKSRANTEKQDWHNHAKSIKDFRSHVDHVVNSHKKEHGTHPTAEHISNEVGKRMNKKSKRSGVDRDGNHLQTATAEVQRNYGLYHTHMSNNKDHGTRVGSNTAHSHMLHWRIHPKTKKVHITGITRHNESGRDNPEAHHMTKGYEMSQRRGSMNESIKELQRRLEELLSE